MQFPILCARMDTTKQVICDDMAYLSNRRTFKDVNLRQLSDASLGAATAGPRLVDQDIPDGHGSNDPIIQLLRC